MLSILAVLGSACARCYAETTEEMLSACRPITQAKIEGGKINLGTDFDSGLCWGSFGTFHALLFTVDARRSPLLHVCLPEDSTRTQLIAIFVKYAEKHPESYSDDFIRTALNALLEVFPCKAKD